MKKSRIFIFLFAVVCVGLCVVVAGLLSSVITVSGVNISSTAFSNFKVYAISLGEYTSKSQAEALAEQTAKKGGAGYIYESDNLYHVLASAYEEENDAKLVQKNLSESGTTSKIIEIEVGEPEFKDISSQQQRKAFLTALAQLKTTYLMLYDISVSLDTEVINETSAKVQIISTNGELETVLKKTTSGQTAIDGIYYQQIANTFDEVENLLTVLKDYENIDGISLSAKIKNSYITILEKTKNLIDLINNKI